MLQRYQELSGSIAESTAKIQTLEEKKGAPPP